MTLSVTSPLSSLRFGKKRVGIYIFIQNPTKYMTVSGLGVVGPLKFFKIPLSDHGVHLKSPQIELLPKFSYELSTYF